ncbi:hypothetical protein Ahy_A06g029117 isoform A [Arachis hypogaea]|uniref:6-phosphogluconate dehydrogenase NADP-binding domain-containing protein n=1 Tax=Arachis hypogaea TaxID=3818 RepID=A0A445CSH6_ARAHY|nr:hypothetical protein Ahy_A06g029117 isoform A [Arachis hypogaea]
MSCKDHDGYAAVSELITHIVGRILEGLMPEHLHVCAIYVAHLFDYESSLAKEFTISQRLNIAIVGFSNMGQFLATTLVRQGHTVLTYSHSDHSNAVRKLGVLFFENHDDLWEEHPKHNILFVDVLFVKEFPKKLLLELLPYDFDVLCTHLMFQPESTSDG